MAENKPIHECILLLHTTWVAVSAGHGKLMLPMKEVEMREIEKSLETAHADLENELVRVDKMSLGELEDHWNRKKGRSDSSSARPPAVPPQD